MGCARRRWLVRMPHLSQRQRRWTAQPCACWQRACAEFFERVHMCMHVCIHPSMNLCIHVRMRRMRVTFCNVDLAYD